MLEHIRLSLFLAEPVFSERQVSALESLISDHLPKWGESYRLSEDDPKYGSIRKKHGQRLVDAINHHYPMKWGQGAVVLSGDRDDVVLFLDTSKSTMPPELNSIGMELVDVRDIGTKSTTKWVEDFFSDAVERLSVRYGNAYDNREFEAKNMTRDANGVSAVGVRLASALPGLYWINFFGEPYVEMIGSDRFLSLPSGSATFTSSGGVVVKLDDSPDSWESPDYRVAEQMIIQHLGSQYFFSREAPGRSTQAPDFKRPSE